MTLLPFPNLLGTFRPELLFIGGVGTSDIVRLSVVAN